MTYRFIFLILLGVKNFGFCNLPEPYNSTLVRPFDGDGWFINGDQLDQCFKNNKITTVIEVGSWLGLSTRYLATKVRPNGTVYAVDTWRGSPDEELHLKDPRLPYLYELFLSNVIHANLTNIIIPVRMDSLEAAKTMDAKADLIYLDASHGTEAVYQDIIHWHPHLNQGGIFCGDDWTWWTVQEGVRKAAKELNLQIESRHNWWRLY